MGKMMGKIREVEGKIININKKESDKEWNEKWREKMLREIYLSSLTSEQTALGVPSGEVKKISEENRKLLETFLILTIDPYIKELSPNAKKVVLNGYIDFIHRLPEEKYEVESVDISEDISTYIKNAQQKKVILKRIGELIRSILKEKASLIDGTLIDKMLKNNEKEIARGLEKVKTPILPPLQRENAIENLNSEFNYNRRFLKKIVDVINKEEMNNEGKNAVMREIINGAKLPASVRENLPKEVKRIMEEL